MTRSRVQSLVGLESVDSLDIRDHYHDGTCEDKDERDNAQSSNDVQSNKIHYGAMVSSQPFLVQMRRNSRFLGGIILTKK